MGRYSENDISERAMNGSENNISKRNMKNAPVPNEECCCTKKSLCWISTFTVTALLILLCIALSHIEWSPKEKTEEIDRETLNQLNVLKKEKLKLEEDVARLKKTNTGLHEQIGVLEALEEEKVELKNELKTTKADLEVKNKSLEKLEKRKSELEQENETSTATIADLQKQIQSD